MFDCKKWKVLDDNYKKMSTQSTKERLDYLVKNYFKSDMEQVWKKYEAACETFGATKQDFLSDATLYPNIDMDNHSTALSVSTIVESIESATDLIRGVDKKRKRMEQEEKLREKSKKKKEEYIKEQGKVCGNCGGMEFVGIGAKCCDNGNVMFPDGSQREGMIRLSGLCDSDGVFADFCVNCGVPFGFNSEIFKKQLDQAQFNEDLYFSDQINSEAEDEE